MLYLPTVTSLGTMLKMQFLGSLWVLLSSVINRKSHKPGMVADRSK